MGNTTQAKFNIAGPEPTPQELSRIAGIVETIYNEHPEVNPDNIRARVLFVMGAQMSSAGKRHRLIRIAIDVNNAVQGHAACRAGCSNCCSLHVSITATEAKEIAQHTGKRARNVPLRSDPQEYIDLPRRFYGVPCTFLREGQCGIYEVRPIECRLHHSLHPTAAQCDTSAHGAFDTLVPGIDAMAVEQAWATIAFQRREAVGDIREFFPPAERKA